jgi:antitoxin Phd
MRSWLVKDARAHFSDVIDGALRGEPQRVSRRGKGAVVVVSEEEWARLAKPAPKMTLGEYLATFPLTAEEWQEIAPARHRQRRDPFEGTD